MPSETNRHPSGLRQVAHASDMPGSIQSAVRVIEAKTKLIDLLYEDLARKRNEIARLELEISSLENNRYRPESLHRTKGERAWLSRSISTAANLNTSTNKST
jgi:hypothetical protein